MEGMSFKRVLSMLIMVSIMLVQLTVAQDDNFVGHNDGDYFELSLNVVLPPETLPYSPETPLFPGAPLPSDITPPVSDLAPNPSPFDPATPSIPDIPSAPTNPSTPPSPTTPLPPATPSIPDSPSAPIIPLTPPLPPVTPLLPPETPLPPIAMTCEDKCAMKCSKLIISFLYKLCFKTCNLKCKIVHSELVYNCTNNCAQSMPASLNSDEGQLHYYVNSCYQKCMSHN